METRAEHAKASGWYSIEVMCHAMNTTSMRVADKVEYTLSLEPLHVNPKILRDDENCVGAVVNIRNRHWVALRSIDKQVWLLDSQEPHPIRLTDAEYKGFISRHRNAFPIRCVLEQLPRKITTTSQSTETSQEHRQFGVDGLASNATSSSSNDSPVMITDVVLPIVSSDEQRPASALRSYVSSYCCAHG